VCKSSYAQPNSYQGFGNIQELNNTNNGCLASNENFSVWYIVNVSTNGNLEFDLVPNTPVDYDFAVWNVTGVGCAGIYAGMMPIRCNYASLGNSPANGGTGLAAGFANTTAGAGGPSYCAPIPVIAGETYMILVDNFAANQTGYNLDFGTSTASIYDTIPPKMVSATTHCGLPSTKLKLKMSENVTCASVAANGSDFYITPSPVSVIGAVGSNCSAPGATYSTDLDLTFSSPIPAGTYTLRPKIGTDGNTVLDNCGNPEMLSDAIVFTVYPDVPLGYAKVDSPACQIINVLMTKPVKCRTIAPDGSDFLIVGPSSTKVISATGLSCSVTDSLIDTIQLRLAAPIMVDGTYTINCKLGTDNNTLLDSCENAQAVGNKITFIVNSFGGLITALPADSAICEPGYVNLRSLTNTLPPLLPPSVTCGPNGTACSGTAVNHKVGSGTNATDTNTPFYGVYDDARSQYLLTASDLAAAGVKPGTITDVALNVTTKLSSLPYTNFNIKMGCTAITEVGSVFIPGLTTVYTNVAGYNTVTGINTFPLATTFDWDGTSNILIEICYDNNDFSDNDEIEATNTPQPTVLQKFDDLSSGCSFPTPDNSNKTMRPNFILNVCEAPPTPGNFEYTWTPGLYVNDSTAQNTLAYVPSTTTFTIRSFNYRGCVIRDTARIIVSERDFDLNPKDTTLCPGDRVELRTQGGVTWVWSGPVKTLSCTDCPNPVALPNTTSTYQVIIGDKYACKDTFKTNVKLYPAPVINAFPADTLVRYGLPVELRATGGVSYVWTPIKGISNPDAQQPTVMPSEPTMYIVTGRDINGCVGTDTVNVRLDMRDKLYMPTAFSPNKDGSNDYFRVVNLTFQKVIEFRVFDRWGRQIFDGVGAGKAITGWDGIVDDQNAPIGVYSYIIRIAYPDGYSELLKGDVTLVR
jgi:gliding motility-associated-like protein